MNVQEQEEQEYTRMSLYAFEAAAVQQEGANRASQRYLLTDFDTWVLNPFWDGVDPSHPEAVQQELEEEYREAVYLAEPVEEWLERISVDTTGVPIFEI